MNRFSLWIAALSLAACAQEPPRPAQKAVADMTPQERCAAMSGLLGSPYTEAFQKAALLERMRNDGCLGTPQPTTIQVR